MRLLDGIIDEIKQYREEKRPERLYREFAAAPDTSWPPAGPRDMVLVPDLAVELGGPQNASVSFILWTNDAARVTDGRITLIGPDISEAPEKQLPLGKIVIVSADGFDEDNAWDRYIEMDLIRFDLSLKGYMIKAAPQYMREWSRISKGAVASNLSLSVVGSALLNEYKKLDYISAAEVMFVTSSDSDVTELNSMGSRTRRFVDAMSKMINEMNFDCSECDFQDICDDAEELREIRKKRVGNAN
jgi:CO dehydrogenase/acetyl-CoA synthase beta subunit